MISLRADLITPTFEKLTYKMYELCHNLFCMDEYKSTWFCAIKDIILNAGLKCVWNTQRFVIKNILCNLVRGSLKSDMIVQWREQFNNSAKCLFYENYKSSIIPEPFEA